ncbi:MAG: tRNA uridine-5-carboxymethylaminomethyl(34) synthesis enzyme MnmG [Sphingobacteriales bacterium]|jgi:tRNA uridine 5-carboxymethylaminomethyl modification enzyme|nr:tRNA uridine-5-carboxymethylaminomethyl(34) synthesis enzyme MnmG [Sphingobacteriales bacterium]
MFDKYDVIIVGAGHAGCEAAQAAATIGKKTLLVTMNMQVIGQMSCNPAMGGVAKGQIVKEIDALGGMSGIISDKSMIQFRMLNRSKGPAMWSPRSQNDRNLFASLWRYSLENTPNLDIYQEMVSELIVKGDKVCGVKTQLGIEIESLSVVLTNGTFLNGLIHIGDKQFGGGRAAESRATGITEQLLSLGLESGRMKTGTPPRIDGRSLDYTKMEVQDGDPIIDGFSFMNIEKPREQRCCWITYTNDRVHEALKEGFDRSPMFNGSIEGVGPRYCPSIEDKINRFADKERHQIFVEPEGWNTNEIYVNGFSTSLPYDVQFKALRLIPGFENAKMYRPGYAIEYDYFPPMQLDNSLQTKLIKGLYFAGQINGTTGYEEAGGQGLIAGINATRFLDDKEPLVLKRDESYIGVLIDDLVHKGTDEPYRMFTSRAEFRILLRGDNADQRLTPIGRQLGLATQERIENYEKRKEEIAECLSLFGEIKLNPEEVRSVFEKTNSTELKQQMPLGMILTRPQLGIEDLMEIEKVKQAFEKFSASALESAVIEHKYQGYIAKEKDTAQKSLNLEGLIIPESFNYEKVNSLSTESRQKLSKIRPKTLGAAKRISGINPSDIAILMVHIGR